MENKIFFNLLFLFYIVQLMLSILINNIHGGK